MTYLSDLKQIESAIAEVLKTAESPYSLRDLIPRVKETVDASGGTIRVALWRLIDRMEVRLTPDLKLEWSAGVPI